jgi:cysteinyl-tRNA synthetase
MAMKYLGETIDIHTGGIDHLPVHHINEIAQSQAATGKQFVRYWLHNNHLLVDNAKISKSAGNSILLHELAREGYDPLDLRLMLLQSHYRTQANFTMGGLQAARQRRQALLAFADLRFQLVDGGELDTPAFVETRRVMLEELQEDMHTPEALAALSDIVNEAETRLVAPTAKQAFEHFIAFADRVLGLRLSESADITAQQKQIIAEREAARSAKDFAKADELRQQLAAQNIELRDTPLATIWSHTL